MNIKKFGKRLLKINRLFDGVQEDGEISSIEQDLLLSYLRDAYEMALENELPVKKATPKKQYKEPEIHVPVKPVRKQNVIEDIASVEVAKPESAPVVEVVTQPVQHDAVEKEDTSAVFLT